MTTPKKKKQQQPDNKKSLNQQRAGMKREGHLSLRRCLIYISCQVMPCIRPRCVGFFSPLQQQVISIVYQSLSNWHYKQTQPACSLSLEVSLCDLICSRQSVKEFGGCWWRHDTSHSPHRTSAGVMGQQEHQRAMVKELNHKARQLTQE